MENQINNLDRKIHQITQSSKFAHEAMLFARIVLGCLFIYHSLSKFGGDNSFFMTLVGVVELISALFILMGTKIRLAGSLLGLVMLGAIYSKIFMWKAGFSGIGGWELDIVALALLFIVVSVDSSKYILLKRK